MSGEGEMSGGGIGNFFASLPGQTDDVLECGSLLGPRNYSEGVVLGVKSGSVLSSLLCFSTISWYSLA